VVGTTQRPNCPDSLTDTLAWEGEDTDGDGILDCETNDNDGDGTIDVEDECPNTPDATCVTDGAPCVPDWAEACFGPACSLFSFHVFDKINPADSIAFDWFQIVDERIYLAALPARTVPESGLVFEGNLLATEPSEDLTIGLEIRSVSTGERVATVGEYQTTSLTNQGLGFGNSLILTLDAEGAPTVASTWGAGIQTEFTLADLDGDETPNIGDNCIEIANAQIDADEDGFGNLCDPDLDGDGLVTEADVDWVRDCEGTDVTISILTRCENQPAESTPPETIAMLRRCRAADLDTDGSVGASDTEIAVAWLGREPGPSATATVTASGDAGGCGCQAPGTARGSLSTALVGFLALLGFIWIQRRRRSSQIHPQKGLSR
jgi:MYXO-CTERM domain-containing protein